MIAFDELQRIGRQIVSMTTGSLRQQQCQPFHGCIQTRGVACITTDTRFWECKQLKVERTVFQMLPPSLNRFSVSRTDLISIAYCSVKLHGAISVVILSAAKNPHVIDERFFAALRMTARVGQ